MSGTTEAGTFAGRDAKYNLEAAKTLGVDLKIVEAMSDADLGRALMEIPMRAELENWNPDLPYDRPMQMAFWRAVQWYVRKESVSEKGIAAYQLAIQIDMLQELRNLREIMSKGKK